MYSTDKIQERDSVLCNYCMVFVLSFGETKR